MRDNHATCPPQYPFFPWRDMHRRREAAVAEQVDVA